MIPWKCACGHSGQTADKNAGKRAKCPKCERIMRLPELAASDFDDDFDEDISDEGVSWDQSRQRTSAELKAKARRAAKRQASERARDTEATTSNGQGMPTWALIAGGALIGFVLVVGFAYSIVTVFQTDAGKVTKQDETPPAADVAPPPAHVQEIIPVSDVTEACYVRPAEAESEMQIWLPGTPTVGSVIADIGRGETPARKWTLDHRLGRFEYICIRNPSTFRHETMLGLARSTVKHLKDEFAGSAPKVTRLSKYGTHGEQAVYSTADGRAVVQYRIYGLGSTAHALVFHAADSDAPEPLTDPVVIKFFGSLGRT